MTTLRKGALVRRNDRCPCGSNQKFKSCCSPDAPWRSLRPHSTREAGLAHSTARVPYIDDGEVAVRWVIVDDTGTRFFVDKDGRVLVFSNREAATVAAHLDEFADQSPGEINVGGVGPTKWQALQEKLPFVEVVDADTAAALIRERIEVRRAQLNAQE